MDKHSRYAGFRAGGGLTWGQALTIAGWAFILIGGMAADSPGTGYLWAAGIVGFGIMLAWLGQALGRR